MARNDLPAMTVCPNCGAPNPKRQVVCFSCGYVSNSAASPVASGIFDTGGMVPAHKPSMHLPGLTIPGWAIETLPDASVRLQRIGWRRFFDDVTLPAICLLFGGMLLGQGLVFPHGRAAVPPASLPVWHLLGAAILVLGAAAAVWQFGAREEIRAGRGFFERTMSLGPVVRRWRFEHAAEIRVLTSQGGDRIGSYTYRRLQIRQMGQAMTLDRHQRRDSLISISDYAPVIEDEISMLGRYLSEVTGWPFADPAISEHR